ncbi:hypothetical protein NE237_031780 [Protea cynaroides]|uniref:F-box domain-containing protein n=1 Tax=Protea cynaroides TaxID=273540 RepID=A0A9Q0L1W6_9MAGN|nr:hypothetical protein NE237_031780 [Protea cynaroides]
MAKENEENEKMRVEESVPTENLPEVLIVEILSRLPLKSLLRFRCVCKFWYDPAFVKMHLSRSLISNSNLNVVFRNLLRTKLNFRGFRVSELHSYSDDLDVWAQQVVVRPNHPFKLPHYLGIVVGSCNGSRCLYTCNSKKEILLWNPSTRRHQKLPSIPKEIPSFDYNVYGFRHDPTTNDYKIVRIVKLRDPTYLCFLQILLFIGLTIANRYPVPPRVLSFPFDLQDEEYRELPLPDFDFVKNNVPMKLGVLGGQLCVLWPFLGVRVEVWLMKEYGVRDSWEKQFLIEQPWVMRNLNSLRPIRYSKTGQVIFQIDLKALVLFDPRRGRVRNLKVLGAPDYLETESFVGSLMLLNGKDGTEREKWKKKNMKQRG